ncbi:hypothetical protein CPC16_006529, partial [Podila verticillata]
TKLILGDIDVNDGQELAKELNRDKKPIAHFVQCDVVNYAQLASLFTAAQDHFGRLDIVVNNAVDGLKIRVNAIAPTFADTRIIAPVRAWVQTQMPLVPVEQVIDAFMMAIEDYGLEGDVLHITPNNGIQVLGRETNRRGWPSITFKL